MEGSNKASELKRADRVLGGEAAREPNWDECTLEVKVERMREALLGMGPTLAQTSVRTEEALKMAKAHQHADDGRVLMPVIERDTYLWNEQGRPGSYHLLGRLR